MPSITVEVPDQRVAEFYIWFGQWLGQLGPAVKDSTQGTATPTERSIVNNPTAPTATASSVARWVRESGHEKLAWDSSADALRAAQIVIDSTTDDAHPLLQAFIDDPHLEATTGDLARRIGLTPEMTQAYRNLLGKQAFYAAGNRCNPITSRSQRGSTLKVLFMTAEARQAFSAALGR